MNQTDIIIKPTLCLNSKHITSGYRFHCNNGKSNTHVVGTHSLELYTNRNKRRNSLTTLAICHYPQLIPYTDLISTRIHWRNPMAQLLYNVALHKHNNSTQHESNTLRIATSTSLLLYLVRHGAVSYSNMRRKCRSRSHLYASCEGAENPYHIPT